MESSMPDMHSRSSASQLFSSSRLDLSRVSSRLTFSRHLWWKMQRGSTVSSLIFILSCCSTHRKFSMKPSVDTSLSSVCRSSTGEEKNYTMFVTVCLTVQHTIHTIYILKKKKKEEISNFNKSKTPTQNIYLNNQ